MTVKDYNNNINIVQDKDVEIEYYFTKNPDEKKRYIHVRDYEIEKIVKCVEDNTFKLKIYVNYPNEIYDDIIKDIEETTKKWLPKYCETHDSCLSCPYRAGDKIEFGDRKTTYCKIKYIAYCVNFNMNPVIACAKGIKGLHDD